MVTLDRLEPSNERGRVVHFGRARLDWSVIKCGNSPVDDLAKYEQGEAEDDYRYRMKMNALGFLVTVMLMVAGMWLVAALTEMQQTQDCYLSGRSNCEPIEFRPTEQPTTKNHWL